jgi:transcriptional regulator with GAF, ATPase, and Fis domain
LKGPAGRPIESNRSSIGDCPSTKTGTRMPVMNASPAAATRDDASDQVPVPQVLEPTDELLRTISEVLDVRQVFPRVAQIANRALPHECLTLVAHDRRGAVIAQERSSQAFPDLHGEALAGANEPWLVRDFREHLRDSGQAVRAPFYDSLDTAGYRSLLRVRTTAHERAVSLGFFSKRVGAYSSRDVPVARRIADVIAVAVSHQHLAGVLCAGAEARARGERLDERVRLVNAVGPQDDALKMVGQSSEWRQVLRKATQVASTDTTVFIRGESGTGKEVVARFIHRASPRKNGPFVAINCAALPEHLLESELFGYERGAFTGAHQAKPGQVELASTGVLFLDEVSEMSPAAQAKLLRFLQEREFQRLGGTRLIKANVRIIAASNRDLYQAVADGDFREDLYYRLQVFDIHIPPLRDRRADIPMLADAFLQEFNRAGCPSAGVSGEALALMTGPATFASFAMPSSAPRCCVRVGRSPRSISRFTIMTRCNRWAAPICRTSSAGPSSRSFGTPMGTSPKPHGVWASPGPSCMAGCGSTVSRRTDRRPLIGWLARRRRDVRVFAQ